MTNDHDTDVLHKTLAAYFDAIAAMDPPRIASLFADNGEIEDPVGTEVAVGREAVQAYFARGLGSLRACVVIEVRGVFPSGDSIAAHWSMTAHGRDGREVRADGIDVIRVSAQGEIRRAEGYWNAAAFRHAMAEESLPGEDA